MPAWKQNLESWRYYGTVQAEDLLLKLRLLKSQANLCGCISLWQVLNATIHSQNLDFIPRTKHIFLSPGFVFVFEA